MIIYSLRLNPGEWLAQLGLHLIFAGAIGNLIDRFSIGWVTDFLEFYWQDFYWPAFNIADSVIVLGVLLLLVDTFRPRRKRKDETQAVEGPELEFIKGERSTVGITEETEEVNSKMTEKAGSDVS